MGNQSKGFHLMHLGQHLKWYLLPCKLLNDCAGPRIWNTSPLKTLTMEGLEVGKWGGFSYRKLWFDSHVHQKLNGTESQRTPKWVARAIRYSGWGVRETWVLLEISWIMFKVPLASFSDGFSREIFFSSWWHQFCASGDGHLQRNSLMQLCRCQLGQSDKMGVLERLVGWCIGVFCLFGLVPGVNFRPLLDKLLDTFWFGDVMNK